MDNEALPQSAVNDLVARLVEAGFSGTVEIEGNLEGPAGIMESKRRQRGKPGASGHRRSSETSDGEPRPDTTQTNGSCRAASKDRGQGGWHLARPHFLPGSAANRRGADWPDRVAADGPWSRRHAGDAFLVRRIRPGLRSSDGPGRSRPWGGCRHQVWRLRTVACAGDHRLRLCCSWPRR